MKTIPSPCTRQSGRDGFNQTGRDALSGAMMSAVLWTLFYNTCFILISFWSKIAETMLVFTA